ncbi:hypothetical protein [Caulobacter endophyticus]|uniref:Uncharacterized protein n=1 Tax=Caulobacter endophyticus TaxID=2172652 RepID=A0A2T9KCB9_9CAUL|nr:hypothetical protein [Caulobacter endophyticus]PVM93614.1 hypothetical protein DDF67_02685 [Caulobacter endophyticus]
MRPDPRLGPWGRLPAGWTASPRRRRLAFVALVAPGVVMAVAGAQVLVSPPLLVTGVVWLTAALAVRWASEPRFLALEAADRPDPEEESAP